VTLYDWIRDSAGRVQADGFDGVVSSGRELWIGALRRVASLSYDPDYVLEKEWDLLVVLDACRLDLFEQVAPQYEFVDTIGSSVSAASSTTGWLRANFAEKFAEECSNIAYVTGNPNSVIVDSQFGLLDEVWRYAWDNEVGAIRPRPVTDRAVAAARDGDHDRMIVHYLQPHHPFLTMPELDRGTYIPRGDGPREKRTRTVWEQLSTGDIDESTVREGYRENLELVLDEVGVLLSNVDADRVVITSDHGNAIGEYGLYGHPTNVPIDVLCRVPWAATTARDHGTFSSSLQPGRGATDDEAVNDRLRDLGYLD